MKNKPNVGRTMTIIHKAISRGMDESLNRSRAFHQAGYPDDATREGFLTYIGSLHKVVDSHHLGEQDLAFPYLKKLLPDAPYDELLSEHHEMDEVLKELGSAIGSVRVSHEADSSLETLSRALSRLIGLWHPHIDKEEHYLYDPQKTGSLMTPEEHMALNASLAQHAAGLGNMEVKVPFILFNLPEEERAVFAGGLPPMMIQELVPTVWRPIWAPMLPFFVP